MRTLDEQREMSDMKSKWYLRIWEHISDNRSIYIITLLFFLIKLFLFASRYHYPIWDEAVYISMSKFFWSFGNSGYLETLRPILIPLIFGFFWKITGSYMFIYEMLEILFACGTIYMTYFLAKEIFNKWTGIVAALLISLTSVFFTYSSYIMTEIPSTFLVLLSFWCIYKKQKYYLAGVFAGLAFLARFPQALFVISVCVFLFAIFIRSRQRKIIFFNGIRFLISSFLTVLPFFVFNFIYYQKETSSWYHATFRPLIYASNLINSTYLWLYDSSRDFFFVGMYKDFPLLAFALLGVFICIVVGSKDKKDKGHGWFFLLITLIVYLIYFTGLNRMEYRYTLSFLPFVVIFAAYGITTVVQMLYVRKGRLSKVLLIVFLIFLLHMSYIKSIENKDITNYRGYSKPPIVTENYEFLYNHPLLGTVITTDPLIGVFIDNKIIPAYYSMQDLEYALKTYDYSAIYMVPRAFPCKEDDDSCNSKMKDMMSQILLDNNLVLNKNFNGDYYYIFTKEDYYTRLSKADLFMKYGMIQDVKLSKFPKDQFPMVLILEDFPSLNDEMDGIWDEEQYRWMKGFFNDTYPSLAIIPTHIQKMASLEISELDYLKHYGGELLQNGLMHNDELKGDLKTQKARIKNGRDIISKLTNRTVSGFIPPFYSADENTIKALEDLDYDIYVSNVGDTTDPGTLRRFDQSLSLIDNWALKSFKSKALLEKEIHYIRSFNDYLMVSLYYYMYTNETYSSLDDFWSIVKDYRLMSATELDSWMDLREKVQFSLDGDQINITAPKESKDLTLLFFGPGDYRIQSDIKKINIKNAIDESIKACFNDDCYTLSAGEIKEIEI